jgi:hypothetical protein
MVLRGTVSRDDVRWGGREGDPEEDPEGEDRRPRQPLTQMQVNERIKNYKSFSLLTQVVVGRRFDSSYKAYTATA